MQCTPGSSILTAEAVDLALDFIRTCDTNNTFIIFSSESYEPYTFKGSTDSKTFRKMPQAFSK